MSRTKNALKIVSSSILQQIVIVICGLILPPLIISQFGSEINGLVSTVKQILTYFSVVSLGIGASCQVALYEPLAKKDIDTVNGVLSVTRIFFNRTGYVYLVLFIGLAILFPFMANSNLNYISIMSIVVITGAGSICEYIFVSKYKILLVADQKQYVIAKVQTQGTIINTVASIIMIYLGADIIIVQLISTLVYVLRLLMLKSYVLKTYQEINFYVSPKFELVKDRWQAFGFQISDMIINYTPIILVAALISLTEASIYSVYNMIFSSLSMIIGVFSSGFAPAFGNLMTEQDNVKLKRTYNTFNFVYRLMAFWVSTCAMILILSFISIYITDTKGVNYISPKLAVLFSLQSLFRNIRTPSNTLVQAAGRFKDNKIPNLLEAIVNVILSVIFGKLFGLAGIIFSGAITGFIRSILFIDYNNRKILGILPIKEYLHIVINLVIMFLMYRYLLVSSVSNYFEWILQGIKVALVSGSVFLIVNGILDKQAVKDFWLRIKTLLHIK